MERKPVFGGNWKLNPTDVRQARGLAAELRRRLGSNHRVDLAIFVPAPYLLAVKPTVEGSRIQLGAQDVYPVDSGAYTGAMSPPMLASVGVQQVLVGHSERRQLFGETDALVRQKLHAALASGLGAVLCVGETEAERDAGATLAVLTRQLDLALEGLKDLRRLVLAYEPVWAIGTGKVASPALAQDVHHSLRRHLAHRLGEDAAQALRIQYGGSVKPDNAAELLAQPDIDGALVGGASLDAAAFAAIIAAVPR